MTKPTVGKQNKNFWPVDKNGVRIMTILRPSERRRDMTRENGGTISVISGRKRPLDDILPTYTRNCAHTYTHTHTHTHTHAHTRTHTHTHAHTRAHTHTHVRTHTHTHTHTHIHAYTHTCINKRTDSHATCTVPTLTSWWESYYVTHC